MRILALEGRQKEIAAELEKAGCLRGRRGGNTIEQGIDGITDELEKLMGEWEGMAAVSSSAGDRFFEGLCSGLRGF